MNCLFGKLIGIRGEIIETRYCRDVDVPNSLWGVAQAGPITLVGHNHQDPVTVGGFSSCSCGDYCLGGLCKKILFVGPELNALADKRNARNFHQVTLTSLGPGDNGMEGSATFRAMFPCIWTRGCLVFTEGAPSTSELQQEVGDLKYGPFRAQSSEPLTIGFKYKNC